MRFSDAFLDAARTQGDPPADAVLQALHDDLGIEAVNRVLMHLVRNDTVVPSELPPAVAQFLLEQHHSPLPGEEDDVRRAEALFATHGVTVLMLLGFSSLPQTYASQNGSHVLVFTQRLTRDPKRRLLETFQFILDCMQPGGLSPSGKGIIDAQKVRLMHASVRRFVGAQPDYDPAWGVPVNQEDLAGTLAAFSVVILDGFRRVGTPFSDEDEAAWVGAWRVVGRNMGVREDLLPRDPADGRALMQRIRERQWGKSSSGQALTQAMVDFYDGFMPGPMKGLPATQIRYFAGDECADILGLPPADWHELVIKAVDLFDRVVHDEEGRHRALEAVAGRAIVQMLEGMEGMARGGNRAIFQIPLSLRGRWFPQDVPDSPKLDVQAALDRAAARLTALQRPDGSWWDVNRGGPAMNAMFLVCEIWAGALLQEHREPALRLLRRTQNADGGWGDSPGPSPSTPTSTFTVYAALAALGLPADDATRSRCEAWVAAHGGVGAADPMSAIFLAMAGLLPTSAVKAPPLAVALAPGKEWLGRKLQGFYLLFMLEVPAVLNAIEKGREAPSILHPLERAEREAALAFLEEHQDPTGSWLGVLPVTALGMAAYVALGLPISDPRVMAARKALHGLLVETGGELMVQPYTSEIWDTAMAARALAAAGVSPEGDALRKAAAFLRKHQGKDPEPKEFQTPAPGAPSTGGWAFEKDNEYGLDTDSTGQVLLTLREAGATADRPANEAAIAAGAAWLRGMQNPDGGWPAFGWGQPSKPRGPIGDTPQALPDTPAEILAFVVDPPAIMRDPSTEELTGRVLWGLGGLGKRVGDPEVDKAVEFLRAQVWTNNAFWGRWTCNFVASTSYVLLGLAAVGLPQTDPLVAQALTWLEAMQQTEGGWGEDTSSYTSPELAGRGAPSPTQTALAVMALCAYGRGREVVATRGVQWLLRQQQADGGWQDPAALSVLLPPTQFYGEALLPIYLGTFALAAYRAS